MRRALSALALALAAVSASGCYVTRAQPRPAGPSDAATAALPSPPFDVGRVDPSFEGALATFIGDLNSIQGRRGDVEEVEVRKTLRLLALAIEKVPHADGVDLSRARQAMRGGRRSSLIGSPGHGSHEGTIGRGLQGISATLVDLARGPYREAPGVLGHAYACDASVRALPRARTARESRAVAIRAMEKAEAALLEMRAAVGRGQVTAPVEPAVAFWGAER